jgi:hypothetical protein
VLSPFHGTSVGRAADKSTAPDNPICGPLDKTVHTETGREFALGLEASNRFVAGEPLYLAFLECSLSKARLSIPHRDHAKFDATVLDTVIVALPRRLARAGKSFW